MTPLPPDRETPSDSPFADDDERWILLDRYLAGDASASGAERVRAWLAADPAHAEILEDVRRIRAVAAHRPSIRSADAAWRSLLPELGDELAQSVGHEHHTILASQGTRRATPQHRPAMQRNRLAAAAVLLVASSVSYGAWHRTHSRATSEISTNTVAAPARAYSTARGQRAEIRLTDGSRVVLAADSRLTIPANFDSTARVVTLDGEAYFDVAHHAGRPFLVRARQAVVQDIGTRFDVRAYATDTAVRLVVTHGRAQLRHLTAPDSSARILVAGEMARLGSNGVSSAAQHVDAARYVAWTQGTLEFAGTPMRDAALDIGRWYDVDVRFADSALAGRRLTATIGDQPLSHVLDQLALALGARIDRRGHTITISNASSPVAPP